jgi:hypothetical protein
MRDKFSIWFGAFDILLMAIPDMPLLFHEDILRPHVVLPVLRYRLD